jgi:hypothetical protein
MEIKITISDTGAGAGAGAGAGGTASMQVSDESMSTGMSVTSSATGGQQVAPPPEILRAAAAVGAIDAGPAPGIGGGTQFGVPPPFSAASDLGDVMTSPGTSAGASAAAMPDSSNVVESVAGPGENEVY